MTIRKSLKAILARADRIEALFAVDIVRDHRNQIVPTVTIDMNGGTVTPEQRERFQELLGGMKTLLLEVYGAKK